MKRRLLLCLFSVALVAGTLYAQEAAFRHPGLLHSEEDFEAVRARLAAGDDYRLRNITNDSQGYASRKWRPRT